MSPLTRALSWFGGIRLNAKAIVIGAVAPDLWNHLPAHVKMLRILPSNGKDRNRRLVAALVVIGFALDKLAMQSALAGPPPPLFQITDVSPDTPYGTSTSGAVTGGRTIQVVVDPTNENTLYLATDIAGVWKSNDAGQHWSPASDGIRNPMTTWLNGRRPLGIDETNPQRLLYATSDDDLRTNHPWGGLYFTDNGAGTWHHVDLPSCSDPNTGDILFSGGTAYVSTRCGMFTGTGDLSDPANWSVTAFPTAASGWQIAVSGATQFACRGNSAYRRTGGAWGAAISLDGDCYDITISPDVPGSQTYIVEWHYGLPGWSVQTVDFAASTHTQLGDSPKNCSDSGAPAPCGCCGQPSVWTVRRPNGTGTGPGHSFDVFVSDMFRFSQYDASTSAWKVVSTVHVDTFTMAFPSSYNPDQGICTAYMTNDGGVYKNLSSGAGCALSNGSGQWVAAMSGLHTMFAYTMAVVPWQPGPAIYLPTGDNETWGTLDGGGTWQDMGCCGDSGKAVVDLALPQQMVTMRNGYRWVYRNAGATPPSAANITSENLADFTFNGKNLYDGTAPPSQGAFAQVMTPAGGTAEDQGDYLQAVAKRPKTRGTTCRLSRSCCLMGRVIQLPRTRSSAQPPAQRLDGAPSLRTSWARTSAQSSHRAATPTPLFTS